MSTPSTLAALVVGLGAACVLFGPPASEASEQVTDTYPDGKLRARYSLDDEERIHGNYTEYHRSGKVRFRVPYRRGARHGAYFEYFDDGKLRIATKYREGELDGTFEERDAKGRPRLTSTYVRGALDGTRLKLDGETEISRQEWSKGELLLLNGTKPYPKAADHIRKTLEGIFALERTAGAGDDADAPLRHEALQWLMAYRFLCDVPHAGMELVPSMNAYAAAGSRLCKAIGRLDHTPKNPGWKKEDYEFAFKGTSRSNLSLGASIPQSVTGYMDDSDPTNIDRVGHRRWCLNPPLLKVGFGAEGKFSAMYCMDRSRKPRPDYDVVSFPPRGLVPVFYFKPHYAWSVSLNPRKFGKPDAKAVRVRLVTLDDDYMPGEAFALNYFKVQTGGAGIPYCVIFRPDELPVEAGARYWLEIDGLTSRAGDPRPVKFLVEFFEL